MSIDKLLEDIKKYSPRNEQEERDKEIILHFLNTNEDAFLRSNEIAHITSSSWIVNQDRTKVLLAYHKIYDSWTWTGGHADGETDLLNVALREAKEETGIRNVCPVTGDIYSLEILTVEGHEKRERYVSSHLHMNVTYLLEADENDEIYAKEDENKAVGWFELEDVFTASTEPWFNRRIFTKLNDALKDYK